MCRHQVYLHSLYPTRHSSDRGEAPVSAMRGLSEEPSKNGAIDGVTPLATSTGSEAGHVRLATRSVLGGSFHSWFMGTRCIRASLFRAPGLLVLSRTVGKHDYIACQRRHAFVFQDLGGTFVNGQVHRDEQFDGIDGRWVYRIVSSGVGSIFSDDFPVV